MTQLWNQNLPSKIVTSLFLLGMITPSPANAGMADTYHETQLITQLCNEDKGKNRPKYMYYSQFDDGEWGTVIVHNKTGNVYFTGKYNPNGEDSRCTDIQKVGRIGYERTQVHPIFGNVITDTWAMENGKLIRYREGGMFDGPGITRQEWF